MRFLRWLNPIFWYRHWRYRGINNVINRAIRDGSTTLSEDECDSVRNFAKDYMEMVGKRKGA